MPNNEEFVQKDIVIPGHSIKREHSELLSFFFPNYKIVTNNRLIIDGPIIYSGPTEYLARLKSFGYPVISITTLGEFDLSSNRTLVNMTFTKWKQKIPKNLINYIDKLDYDKVLIAVKIHWITGKWTIKKYNDSGDFNKLAESFIIDTPTILNTYLTLLKSKYATGAYFEKAIMSFLVKVSTNTKVNSPWYSKILRQYQNGKKYLLHQAMEKYIDTNIWNKDLKIYNLLQDLNRTDKIYTKINKRD